MLGQKILRHNIENLEMLNLFELSQNYAKLVNNTKIELILNQCISLLEFNEII